MSRNFEHIPSSCGVYMMKNRDGRVIYIGKASNLKSRVRSYFSGKDSSRPQISYLMREVPDTAHITTITTADEREALILENSLAKKHKPKFNIQLKDDKTYPSLRLSMSEDFPRISITRRIKGDGASYFGPFPHGGVLKKTAALVQKLFQIRDCSNAKFKRHKDRPCLNYDMKLCSAPCAGLSDRKRYGLMCAKAESFLRGKRGGTAAVIKGKMKKAASEARYEDAAYYRDQLKALEKSRGFEKVATSNFTDKDVIAAAADEDSFEFVVLFHRAGGVADKFEFSAKNTGADTGRAVGEFIGRFYDGGRQVPREIVVPEKFEHSDSYEKWLSEKRGAAVKIIAPSRGARAKLLRLAAENASEAVRKKRLQKQQESAVTCALKKSLKLSKPPRSIECLDISNTQGRETTGAVVRFSEGAPDKNRYRRYKIKTVIGADDFASIREMLSRRLKRAGETGWELPDLILIDGGKGHLSAAVEAMKKLRMTGAADIAAIAKGRTKTEGDSVRSPRRKTPWTPVKNREGLFLLMRIRDEAHRFALAYHKKLRTKEFFASK